MMYGVSFALEVVRIPIWIAISEATSAKLSVVNQMLLASTCADDKSKRPQSRGKSPDAQTAVASLITSTTANPNAAETSLIRSVGTPALKRVAIKRW